MASYDPTVLQTFADRLYQRAAIAIVQYTIMGAVFGILPGVSLWIVREVFPKGSTVGQWASAMGIVGFIFGAFVGWTIGVEKAYALRLEAQRTLVLVEIEKNTRGSVAPKAQ